MTREEYERLLQSDYWKGYSYSLIKERNFTCEDCGRSFPNERNKLQVHHLVYRDANPWSYSPDELVVLCEDCHKKRHGILPETEPKRESIATETDNYTRSYSSDYNTSEKDVRPRNTDWEPVFYPQKKRTWKKFLVPAVLLAAILYFGIPYWKNSKGSLPSSESEIVASKNQEEPRKSSPVVKQQAKQSGEVSVPKEPIKVDVVANEQVDETMTAVAEEDIANDVVSQTQILEDMSIDPPATTETYDEENYRESIIKQAKQAGVSAEGTTAEILDRIYRANVVKMAQQAGVSTEGTPSEILDRINHASVTSQAQREGVSTEGTTSEILDRINHANVVKQAQRTGVSTEGSTSEILDRINHANVVKQAQRAGVSTEGSTSEILDRINHANVVKMAQRAGVSTEGSTSEILDRINHANVVKMALRAGVSTEGSTSEILDRINHANVVKMAQRAGVSTESSTPERE